jgi:glycerol uptake facilitator-like aquaporin
MTLGRRLTAEGLGSFLLFATVVGSGIMGVRLGAGNDAVALLGNTLATAAMLAVLIAMLGPISGAHFNPAVSLVAALRRELAWHDAAAYTVVQLVAGIAGVWAVHLMFEQPVLQVAAHVRAGPAQWFSEGLATFGLVLTILGTVRHRVEWVPASVALYITAGYWFTASTSFANPAITVARSMSNSFAGIAPAGVPGFVAAQLVGALLAAGLAHWLFAPD